MTKRWFALPALALLLAGCGRTPSGDRVASLATVQPTSSSSSSAASSPEDQLRAFARCMREHGIDLPDPQVATGGESGGTRRGRVTVNVPRGSKTDRRFAEAERACKKYLPTGKELPQNDPQALDRALEMARCLRQHGVDVPDPRPDEPGIKISADGKDEAKVRRAMEACAPSRPGAGGPAMTTREREK
jgi:hypothetical protein